MREIHRRFRWIAQPQLLLGFAALCLCAGALGNVARPAYAPASSAPEPHVKGAHSTTPIMPDCTKVPCISLTFDDGPSDSVTPRVLDILKQHNVRATFFVMGRKVPGREALLQRTYREGHEIGNHTWSHPHLPRLTPIEVEEQVRLTQQAVVAAGVPAPHVLRPPYGEVDAMVRAHARMPIVRWNIDPEDWLSNDPAAIYNGVMTHVSPGSIILLHDIHEGTVATLDQLLKDLTPRYQFVTSSELLNLTTGDQGQYFSR